MSKKTLIGGQALIEGIMMKGPYKVATVVRKADGEMISSETPVKQLKDKYPILGWPFIRGTVGFVETMIMGVSAITFSASQYEGDDVEVEPDKFDMWIEKKFGKEKAEKMLTSLAVFIGILIPVALFILLPTLLAGIFQSLFGSGLVRNLIEGGFRILIFLAFLFTVSRMKDMKRVFAYHGAEHKTIYAYESGEGLTVENARKQSRLHPRCGTSFLFVVIIISILVFSLFKWSNPIMRLVLRLLLLPVVVGISYEINRLAGRYDNPITKLVRAPGLALQRLTTNEPDDSMIEVAIEALKKVIPEDGESDKW